MKESAMHPRNVFLTGAVSAILLVAATTAASAATAYASTTVNVRAGAGTGYPVVDVLRRGERVEVEYCRGNWCAVEKAGPDGWVNANYLDAGGSYREYDDYDEPDFFIVRPRSGVYVWPPYYRNRACIGGPNASFCITD
jgi:uncharacterized protein YraI